MGEAAGEGWGESVSGEVREEAVTACGRMWEVSDNAALSEGRSRPMPQRCGRLQSQKDRVLTSCLVSEARKGAGMAAEKIRGVRGGGRQ